MKNILFDILFSPKLEGSKRIDELKSIIKAPCRTIEINCSSVDFFEEYLQKILDEFPYINNLKWCKWDEQYEEGGPHELYFTVIINGIEFLFHLIDVDRIGAFPPYPIENECNYLHPGQYNPSRILSTLTRGNHSERKNGLNEWLRFIDGFILFNDLEFRFMKKNEGEPNLSLFRFEEKEGEDGYWIFNDSYIEDDGEYGEGEYIQFELMRKGDSFLCVSREFVPDPPLPPK